MPPPSRTSTAGALDRERARDAAPQRQAEGPERRRTRGVVLRPALPDSADDEEIAARRGRRRKATVRTISPPARRSPRRGAGPARRPTRAPAARASRAGTAQAANSPGPPGSGASPSRALPQSLASSSQRRISALSSPPVYSSSCIRNRLSPVSRRTASMTPRSTVTRHTPGRSGIGLGGQAERVQRRRDRAGGARVRLLLGRLAAGRLARLAGARGERLVAERRGRSSRGRAAPRRGRSRRAGRRSARPARRRRRDVHTSLGSRLRCSRAGELRPDRGCPRSAPSPRASCRRRSSR